HIGNHRRFFPAVATVNVLQNLFPSLIQNNTPLQAEDIADIIWFAVTRPPHVNIADLTVMCLDQASSTIVNKVDKP
ncbi:MAG: hypothetical protein AAF466_06530, partial [Bacteroidota bacterium]